MLKTFGNKDQALAFVKSNDQYTFVAQNLQTRLFYVFETPDAVEEVGDHHLCEYIRENQPRRMYIDYEDYFPLGTYTPDKIEETCEDLGVALEEFVGMKYAMDETMNALNRLTNTEAEDSPITPYIGINIRDYYHKKSKQTLQKLSIHAIFYGFYFTNHEQMKMFVDRTFTPAFHNMVGPNTEGEGVDMAVYNRNQSMRMFGQTKTTDDPESALKVFDVLELGMPDDVPYPGTICVYGETPEQPLPITIPQNTRTIPQNTRTISQATQASHVDDTLLRLLYETDAKHFDNHHEWIRIGFVCINEGISLEHFTEASKKSVHWSDITSPGWIADQWESFIKSQSTKKATQATLWHWLKQDNPALFRELNKSRDDLKNLLENLNHNDTAKYFWNENPDQYVYHPKMGWYMLEANNVWTESDERFPPRMKQKIATTLQKAVLDAKKTLAARHAEEMADTEDTTALLKKYKAEMSTIKQCYNKLGSSDFINGVLSFISAYYTRDDLQELLNKNTNLFTFEDKVYDLVKKEFRDIRPDDWVSITTGYDAPESSDPTMRQELNDFLYGLFENQDTATYVLRLMSSCLCGVNRWEELYIMTGSGSNGKGVIAQLMKLVFGAYYYSVDVSLFTKPVKNRDQALPALVESRHSRVMMSTEPEKDDLLQTGILKKVAGDDDVEARTLHSKVIHTYKPPYKVFIQTNGIPKLNTLDGGIQRRLRVIPFPFKFVASPVGETQRQGDPDVKHIKCKSIAWRDEMMLMLLESIGEIKGWKSLPMPTAVMEATTEYLSENDPVGTWLRENCEITADSADTIKARDLYGAYEQSVTRPISNVKFASGLAYNGVEKKKTTTNTVYMGIKWKTLECLVAE